MISLSSECLTVELRGVCPCDEPLLMSVNDWLVIGINAVQ